MSKSDHDGSIKYSKYSWNFTKKSEKHENSQFFLKSHQCLRIDQYWHGQYWHGQYWLGYCTGMGTVLAWVLYWPGYCTGPVTPVPTTVPITRHPPPLPGYHPTHHRWGPPRTRVPRGVNAAVRSSPGFFWFEHHGLYGVFNTRDLTKPLLTTRDLTKPVMETLCFA